MLVNPVTPEAEPPVCPLKVLLFSLEPPPIEIISANLLLLAITLSVPEPAPIVTVYVVEPSAVIL